MKPETEGHRASSLRFRRPFGGRRCVGHARSLPPEEIPVAKRSSPRPASPRPIRCTSIVAVEPLSVTKDQVD